MRRQSTSQAKALATLVALLRAVYQTHQASHWQTRAKSYYGDHLLYQRLYEGTLPEIDQVAERAIGTGGLELLDPGEQSALTTRFVSKIRGQEGLPSPRGLAAVSLRAETALLRAIDQILALGMSQGTQNLLQGIADKHEGHVYLLQQRLAQG